MSPTTPGHASFVLSRTVTGDGQVMLIRWFVSVRPSDEQVLPALPPLADVHSEATPGGGSARKPGRCSE